MEIYKILISAIQILWLNSEEKGTDWTESFRDPIARGLLSIDEDLKSQERSTNDCLAIKFKKKENSGPVSAILTVLNCNEKANKS